MATEMVPELVGELSPGLHTRPEASSVRLWCHHHAHPGTGPRIHGPGVAPEQGSPRQTHFPSTLPSAASPAQECGAGFSLRCFGPYPMTSQNNQQEVLRETWERSAHQAGDGGENGGTVTSEPGEEDGKGEEREEKQEVTPHPRLPELKVCPCADGERGAGGWGGDESGWSPIMKAFLAPPGQTFHVALDVEMKSRPRPPWLLPACQGPWLEPRLLPLA